jgi:acyl carrier protein
VERALIEPRTPLEALVASIWMEVLRIERLSIDDSFFALGGHSLMATQVISRVREALGVDVPLMLFFTARPTVAAFVEAVEQFIIEHASEADAELAMAEIGTLSDGEVQKALADDMRIRTTTREARERG